MDWIDLAEDRDSWREHVNSVMNLWVPLNVGIFLTSGGTVSFSGRTMLQGFIYLFSKSAGIRFGNSRKEIRLLLPDRHL